MAGYQSAKIKTETTKQVKANKPAELSKQKINPHQMLAAPDTLRPEDVLAAQQQLGNQVVQRALDDKREKRGLTDSQGNLRDDLSSTIQQARGSGSTLPKEIQNEMQHKLGQNFSNVRLHTDDKADKLSRTISARAFTIGSDIFFKNGVYAPSTQSGRETLIHELTHVVQQSRSNASGGKLKLGAPNTAMEQEADRKGKQGSHTTVSTSASGIQRSSAEEEEVQTQSEEEELQMQAEEEEIQMQEDEEEIQMQPDAGGVVQRNFLTDLFKKKKTEPAEDPNKIPDAPEYKPQTDKPAPRGKPSTEKGLQVIESIKKTKPAGPSEGDFRAQLINQKKHMGLSEFSSGESKMKHAHNMSKLEGEQTHRFERDTSEGVGLGKQFSRVTQREKLVKTLKDPKSTPEQLKEAEDQLRTFHKSGAFKKNPASVALKERKKLLKESARGGDAKAMELYKKENPGLLSKLGGYASKAQDFYGKHKDTIGTVMGVLGIGGKDKKEEKAPGGGGGDGGGYAVIISQLMQENKMLKDQLAKK